MFHLSACFNCGQPVMSNEGAVVEQDGKNVLLCKADCPVKNRAVAEMPTDPADDPNVCIACQ